jgi:hypothetical protein
MPRPFAPGASDSVPHMMGDQMVRHMIVRDVSYDTLGFDPAAHAAALQALSRRMDASDPDISAFQKRGGRLLPNGRCVAASLWMLLSIANIKIFSPEYRNNTPAFYILMP